MDWLKKEKIKVVFHDYKKLGISKEKLTGWCNELGWELLVNKKSTTWRELPDEVKKKIITPTAAIRLMMENTSIIKRPIIECGDKLLVGFNEAVFIKQLK